MSAAAGTLNLNDWLIGHNRSVSQIQVRSEQVVTRVRNRLWLVKELWSIYRDLRSLVHDQNHFLEQFSDRDIRPEDFDAARLVASTMSLYRSLIRLIAFLQERGYTNAALTGTIIDAIRGASVNIIDYAELLETSFDLTTRAAIEGAQRDWDCDEV